MDFELSQEQAMVRDIVRGFAERELLPLARQDDRNEYYRPEIIKKLGALGFVGGPLPEEYGGSGIDNVTQAVIAEEIGHACLAYLVAICMVQLGLVQLSILRFGSDEQKLKYLSRLAKGEILGCFGAVEPNVGSDAAAVETTALAKGDVWVLNGTKTWITNAGVADVAIILARTDRSKGGKGLATFLVDLPAPGFSTKTIEGKLGIRSTNTAVISLEDCSIPRKNLLGEMGMGLTVALSAIDNARFNMAAGCVGLAQACIDASTKYAQQRHQFGRPIGTFQLIQEKLADTVVETQAARFLVYNVGNRRDRGLPYSQETAIAKYYASRVAVQAADRAMQIYGGYSYSDDFPVERYYRDARVAGLFAGTDEIQKLIIAQHALGIRAVS